MEGWWWISISLIYCKFHGGDLWSCQLSLISISPLLNALKLLIRGMLKDGNTLGTITLSLSRSLGMPCRSTQRQSIFYVSKSEKQPHSFQTEITCKMYQNLELQPRFSKDTTRENAFQCLSFFCANSNFFSHADFLLELQYSMMTWQEPGVISHELIPKYVWGLKPPFSQLWSVLWSFLSILSILFLIQEDQPSHFC